ncbi:MFS transporter [Pyrenophora seminiperda CCB06]|uniref:MFS transporter n=1 Tax=Pyrenophora seminiperda CCB06 TaxID=1302712 RepID=A0A3M7MG28_9PLEO|nr:MFS transporter [Pyrenophora seminiperda CCB06]
MPGLFTPSPSRARASMGGGFFDSPVRPSYAPETSGRQVLEADVHETRKRSRYGRDTSTTAISGTSPWNDNSLSNSRSIDTKSPPPLANDRYELAGGMDGSHNSTASEGDYDDYFNLQKQRGTWSVPPTPQVALNTQAAAAEMHATPGGSRSWSLIGLVGGVAGKLFQFCTVPFRGFQAGGGQRYGIDSHGEVAAKLGLQDDPYPSGAVQQSTPGGFPSDNYGEQSTEPAAMQPIAIEPVSAEPVFAEPTSPDRPRMTKRLRTTDNWVVVGTNCETETRPSTPRVSERRLPGHTRTPSYIPRPVSRANMATPSSNKRNSLIPVSRRSTMGRQSFGGSPLSTPGSTGQSRAYNRHSYGSPVMFGDTKSNKSVSPLPKESQRLIGNVGGEEFEEDEVMRRMSMQMTAMLKEANEALGTKFEVMECDDDYGVDSGGNKPQPVWFS